MAKAKAQIETAADKYRRLKTQAKEDFLNAPPPADVETFDFTSPSGMEWKLRGLDMALMVENGILPMSFAERMVKAVAGANGDETEAFKTMPAAEQVRAIELSAAIVRYCCVSPRVVAEPQGDDEIAFDEVTIADFNAIVSRVMGGGNEAASLATFRGKR